MAIIKCPECGQDVSDKTKKCIHCGYKLPKEKKLSTKQKKKLGIILFSIILIIILAGLWYFFFCPVTVKWFCHHHVNEATCTNPQTCIRCQKTWGEANGHDWQAATCTEPKTCKVCGVSEGSAIGHVWQAATCTEPKTCRVCGEKEGSTLAHTINDYICSRCQKSFVTIYDVPDILDITSITYDINYVGGIDIYMNFTNQSSKTIDYITVKLQFYNKVGDVLYDDISWKDYTSLLFTGPLKPGAASGRVYWRACFYNSTFGGTLNIQEIKIEYSDGTTLILDESVADYAVKSWR